MSDRPFVTLGGVKIRTALLRYRIMAYVVGVMLLVLTLIAMPMKYIGDDPTLVETVGPVHGFLYAIYVIVTIDLAFRLKWSIGRMLAIALAGTIPFLSFVAERRVTQQVSADADATA